MSFGIGAAKIAYQKTKVFDTAGAHTFIHPLPGKNIEVFVELYGGGGGSSAIAGDIGTDGGDTIWNTASEALVCDGGSGSSYDNKSSTGLSGPKGLYKIGTITDEQPYYMSGVITNGSNHYGSSCDLTGGFAGNVGDVKRFNRTINGDINITVGAGGTGDGGGDGQSGAAIVHYNVIESETPIMVSATPEVDQRALLSWRTAMSTAAQSITANTIETLILTTEVFDEGNFVSAPSGNAFTVGAGKYDFRMQVPVEAPEPGDVHIRLYNVTDGILIDSQTLIRYGTGGAGNSPSENVFEGSFSLGSPKSLRLEIVASATVGVRLVGKGSAIPATLADVGDRTKILLTRKAYS